MFLTVLTLNNRLFEQSRQIFYSKRLIKPRIMFTVRIQIRIMARIGIWIKIRIRIKARLV